MVVSIIQEDPSTGLSIPCSPPNSHHKPPNRVQGPDSQRQFSNTIRFRIGLCLQQKILRGPHTFTKQRGFFKKNSDKAPRNRRFSQQQWVRRLGRQLSSHDDPQRVRKTSNWPLICILGRIRTMRKKLPPLDEKQELGNSCSKSATRKVGSGWRRSKRNVS